MLTILSGTDTKSRDARLHALESSALKKGAVVRTYTDVSFNQEEVQSLAGDASLFGENFFVILRNILGDDAHAYALEKIFTELQDSSHSFVIVDQSIASASVKKYEKQGIAVETFIEKKKEKTPEVFNVFTLTDAFANKKRTQAWTLYRTALALGLEARELHSKLFWVTKTLILARDSAIAQEAGLHPFVFGKSKKSAELFKTGQLESIAYDLSHIFHEAQFGAYDLETKLESFILRALA